MGGPGKPKLAWEISSELLQQLREVKVVEPLEAKQLGNAFLSAALSSKHGGKKECCYEKVADGVWSCCDGTFVTTNVASLTNLFRLAESAPKGGNDETRLPEKLQALLESVHRSGSFKPLARDDPRMLFIPWEKMKQRAGGL